MFSVHSRTNLEVILDQFQSLKLGKDFVLLDLLKSWLNLQKKSDLGG